MAFQEVDILQWDGQESFQSARLPLHKRVHDIKPVLLPPCCGRGLACPHWYTSNPAWAGRPTLNPAALVGLDSAFQQLYSRPGQDLFQTRFPRWFYGSRTRDKRQEAAKRFVHLLGLRKAFCHRAWKKQKQDQGAGSSEQENDSEDDEGKGKTDDCFCGSSSIGTTIDTAGSGERNGERDGDGQGDNESKGDCDGDSDGGSDSDGDSNGDSDSDGDGDGCDGGDGDGDSDGDSDGYSDDDGIVDVGPDS